MNKLSYLYRRYFGWFPIQFCIWCGKPYWGGWPMFDMGQCVWLAWMKEFCSKQCSEASHDFDDLLIG